jgi:hypothetical protein
MRAVRRRLESTISENRFRYHGIRPATGHTVPSERPLPADWPGKAHPGFGLGLEQLWQLQLCHAYTSVTLILTRASMDFVIQASDRRITDDSGAPLDDSANKSIVYVCANAAVAISYTGLAILGGVATDEWLVERLTGQTLARDLNRQRPPVLGSALNQTHETVGAALRRCTDALQDAEKSLTPSTKTFWKDTPFELIAAGYQWNARGRYRPIFGWIGKEKGDNCCALDLRQRHWHYQRAGLTPTALCANPLVNLPASELGPLSARLYNQSSEDISKLLVCEIRRVSTQLQHVGADVLTIAISPPPIAEILVEDHPVKHRQLPIRSTFKPGLTAPVSLMPWIVGPGIVRPPAFCSHSSDLLVGRYRLRLTGPLEPGNVVFEGSAPRLREFPLR